MARTNNRLILDLVKDATSESNSIVDLTPYFQGRVGDSNATFPMGLTWAGRVKSLTGYNVNFKGTDSQGLAFNITNGAKDSGPGDDFGIGRFSEQLRDGLCRVRADQDSRPVNQGYGREESVHRCCSAVARPDGRSDRRRAYTGNICQRWHVSDPPQLHHAG